MVDTETSVRDRVEREVVLAAPRERVWAALTQPEQLARWFAEATAGRARPV